MIKKLLGYIIVIVLVTFAYVCAFRGINVYGFNILSYEQLEEKQKEYQQKAVDYKKLTDNEYQEALAKLETAKLNFETNKNGYSELKNYGSFEQLLELTRDKQYSLELLWVKLDLIANNNNLNAKFTLEDNSTGEAKNLNIVLVGEYLAVKNYIYDILVDLELQLKADNIVIEPSGEGVTASFVVKDIKVVM